MFCAKMIFASLFSLSVLIKAPIITTGVLASYFKPPPSKVWIS